MSKEWGKQCDYGVGLCFNGPPTSWCSGQHPCIGGDVGDLGIMQKSPEEIEASTTKFVLDKDDKLLEVGMLADAGLMAGDTLTGLYLVGSDVLEMSKEEERIRILTWDFDRPLINVLFERKGLSHTATLKNPKSS
jgi:hypothetical protein